MNREQLEELMGNPKYWRDQDPEYVKKITDAINILDEEPKKQKIEKLNVTTNQFLNSPIRAKINELINWINNYKE